MSKAIDKLKFHKAYLDIPNEAMKNDNAKRLLQNFFNLCFISGLSPTDWDLSNIKPIPKKDKDPRDPLQNRCITIMCCISKVYSKIINTRIQKYLEDNNLLVDEQNGFRASRSCIDHLFVLCTILRNRKLSGQDTFLCFIDFKKAFDSVDRTLLLYKLSQIGITGNIYRAVAAMYSNPQSRVVLNDYETDYFDCPIGVKQGDCLSPTLFAIFINDLAQEIKNSNVGLVLDVTRVGILLYADDIVLMTESEEDLQFLLHLTECWCKKWRLEINLSKTNIMHVRQVRKQQSRFMFLFDRKPVQYCESYKYLGATINYHLDYNFTCNILANSASRALSSVITKMIKNGGFPYKVYTILYNACVTSIVDYGGEVTGFTQYDPSLQVHLKAVRAFLGLPKNSCSVGVLSEVDWLLPEYRTQVRMVRQYNRILRMDNNRLTKKVMLWDRYLNERNEVQSWSGEVKIIFERCGLLGTYETGFPFVTDQVVKTIDSFFQKDQAEYLKQECLKMPKLRTFTRFKDFGSLPSYLTKPLSFIQRKKLAKLRLGCLELRIESGRYCRPTLDFAQRVCPGCEQLDGDGETPVETELHFLYDCPLYSDLREVWLDKMQSLVPFQTLQEEEKMECCLNNPSNVKSTAQFIVDAFNLRSKFVNKHGV